MEGKQHLKVATVSAWNCALFTTDKTPHSSFLA